MSHETIQIYVAGAPILTQRVILDSLRVSVEHIDGGVTRRAADGTLWVQRAGTWRKRVVTVLGQGVGPVEGFGAYLHQDAVLVGVGASLAGTIIAVSAPDKNAYSAEDGWSITIEEY